MLFRTSSESKEIIRGKISTPLIRIGVMAIPLAALLFVSYGGRYTGLGTNLISASFAGETIYGYDWILKLLFTVFTLAIGFQGGEVTPLFSIGVSLGVVLGYILGIPPMICGALGYAAVFGSATNTLIAPILIGLEVFGTRKHHPPYPGMHPRLSGQWKSLHLWSTTEGALQV